MFCLSVISVFDLPSNILITQQHYGSLLCQTMRRHTDGIPETWNIGRIWKLTTFYQYLAIYQRRRNSVFEKYKNITSAVIISQTFKVSCERIQRMNTCRNHACNRFVYPTVAATDCRNLLQQCIPSLTYERGLSKRHRWNKYKQLVQQLDLPIAARICGRT